jgi:hypothetical protein
MLLTATAVADPGVKPASAADTWTQGTGRDEHGQPVIHSLRDAALNLVNRARYRWRIGISWRFHHALPNGMPSPEDRARMKAIDDVIFRDFGNDDHDRIVYLTTGGGIRELMIYRTSGTMAWKRIDALCKQFPDEFPGDRQQWAYVKEDANWDEYRSVLAMVRSVVK